MSEEKDIQNEENVNEAIENQEESTVETTVDAAETEEKKEPTIEEKYNELNDRFLRLYAEFENFRRRELIYIS